MLLLVDKFVVLSYYAMNFIYSHLPKKTAILVVDTYYLMTGMFVVWTPAFMGLLIKWSISGFLQKASADTNNTSTNEDSMRNRVVSFVKTQASKVNSKVASW
ncbi:hypothetical protein Y032_0033g2714 [Ancylostoma ceylanicum]|uniref:Uncharacterized protein n=1 Tax=Ancylostoma ceylanicum TaxID=53326 RepID=A0A016UNS6_9BILA|nr:hypothetical protein Y032_0033g2714 [Ancylostoma ceylanicum]